MNSAVDLLERQTFTPEEFARKTDDSGCVELWQEADIVFIGVSRAGKTTLCKELAKYGVLAVNVPIIYDCIPNAQKRLLKDFVAAGKPLVVGVHCSTESLIARRMQSSKWKHQFEDFDKSEFKRELLKAKDLMGEVRCNHIVISSDNSEPEGMMDSFVWSVPEICCIIENRQSQPALRPRACEPK